MSTELRAEKLFCHKDIMLTNHDKNKRKTEIDRDNESGTRRRKETQDTITIYPTIVGPCVTVSMSCLPINITPSQKCHS